MNNGPLYVPVSRAILKKALYPFIIGGVFEKWVSHNIFALCFYEKRRTSQAAFLFKSSQKRGKYKLIKTIVSGRTGKGIEGLINLGRHEMENLSAQPKLFTPEKDNPTGDAFSMLNN